jgi:hypothetical protein
MRQTLNER